MQIRYSLSITFILLISICNSQISLLHQTNTLDGMICLEKSGIKFIDKDTATGFFSLYNLDFTHFKSISYPGNAGQSTQIRFLSEALFDSDSSTIEFLVDVYNPDQTLVMRENGDTLLHRMNYLSSTAIGQWLTSGKVSESFGIIKTDNGSILTLKSGQIDYLHYSIPGYQVPCDCMCDASFNNEEDTLLGLKKDEILDNEGDLIFPNPVSSGEVVNYTMHEKYAEGTLRFFDLKGRLILKQPLLSKNTEIKLDADKFPSGTYIYQFANNAQAIGANRLIVID